MPVTEYFNKRENTVRMLHYILLMECCLKYLCNILAIVLREINVSVLENMFAGAYAICQMHQYPRYFSIIGYFSVIQVYL